MISVLLATANRPEMVDRFVNSLADTTSGHKVELIIAADGEHIPVVSRHGLRVTVNWLPVMRGSSKAWNDALGLSGGDPVVLAADDIEWQPGWLDAALHALAGLPDGWGFVGLNDGVHGAELATHYLMSRRFIVEILGGRIAWECYTHSFNDVEINERARTAGRYVWCEDARIVHHHWLWGTRPQDGTDLKNLPGHAGSQQAFYARQAQGFPSDYEPVITH